jgi:D-3-phosphoglycerate dehydrogenase
MNVLYIGHHKSGHPWGVELYENFRQQATPDIPWREFDHSQPVEKQFEGVDIVFEDGFYGKGTELINAAADAGVRLWQTLCNGTDHMDLQAFRDRGLALANAPGQFSAIALAEHALYVMFHFAKKHVESLAALQEQVICVPVCRELSGATLGLVGLGASGKELAPRAAALGMRVLATDLVKPSDDELESLSVDTFLEPGDLISLARESDYLSLHVPLTEQTRNMIDRSVLEQMKPSSILINVARSEIVNEEALIEILQQKRIRGAGLDVFPHEPVDPGHPLLKLDHVIATPHTAGVTEGTARRRAGAGLENVRRMMKGEPILHQVKNTE